MFIIKPLLVTSIDINTVTTDNAAVKEKLNVRMKVGKKISSHFIEKIKHFRYKGCKNSNHSPVMISLI